MPSIRVIADTVQLLSLSSPEIDMIIEEAERILTETLAAHELFVSNGRSLQQDSFKLAKTKESVQVYRSREMKNGRTCSSRSTNRRWSNKDANRDRSNTSGTTVVSDHSSTGRSIVNLGSPSNENLPSDTSNKVNSAPPDHTIQSACGKTWLRASRVGSVLQCTGPRGWARNQVFL
ncbi:hypothetical protein PybrP1_011936 [[Pythium] brassicae (nom. inval.)]|nr:hypothetical protein PybrP1_011936 [[Pythium] brassicae (nom. inval.)]